MASQSETFFDDYAMALNTGDAETVTDFHLLPTIFMTDDSKKVCSERSDLIGYNESLLKNLNCAGVAQHIPLVNQAMRLSDSVLFCNVRWRCLDATGNVIFSSTCSYTLQNDASGSPKIIVVVLDGEETFLGTLGNLK